MKKLIKSGLMLVIDCNASPTVIVMKLTRTQLVKLLDYLIPDEEKSGSE